MLPSTSRAGRARPLTVAALLLIGGGVVGLLRQTGGHVPDACDPGSTVCPPSRSGEPDPAGAAPPATLKAADACRNVGYLCSGLSSSDRIVVQRWRAPSGAIVVHVAMPELRDAAEARTLQRAAAAGVRLWNGQPFPILVDERGNRAPHVTVRWASTLPGTQLGVTHTEWSLATGLAVRGVELASTLPGTDRAPDPDQVRLVAAHEMGHALGLPHSDQPRDVMYPTNTATALSARDYRTLDALYSLEDGTVIVR